MISGEGAATDAAGESRADLPAASAATSASERPGDSLAEGAAEPGPLTPEVLPDLFIDQNDPDTVNHQAGIEFARLYKASERWPPWFKNNENSLK